MALVPVAAGRGGNVEQWLRIAAPGLRRHTDADRPLPGAGDAPCFDTVGAPGAFTPSSNDGRRNQRPTAQ